MDSSFATVKSAVRRLVDASRGGDFSTARQLTHLIRSCHLKGIKCCHVRFDSGNLKRTHTGEGAGLREYLSWIYSQDGRVYAKRSFAIGKGKLLLKVKHFRSISFDFTL